MASENHLIYWVYYQGYIVCAQVRGTSAYRPIQCVLYHTGTEPIPGTGVHQVVVYFVCQTSLLCILKFYQYGTGTESVTKIANPGLHC